MPTKCAVKVQRAGAPATAAQVESGAAWRKMEQRGKGRTDAIVYSLKLIGELNDAAAGRGGRPKEEIVAELRGRIVAGDYAGRLADTLVVQSGPDAGKLVDNPYEHLARKLADRRGNKVDILSRRFAGQIEKTGLIGELPRIMRAFDEDREAFIREVYAYQKGGEAREEVKLWVNGQRAAQEAAAAHGLRNHSVIRAPLDIDRSVVAKMRAAEFKQHIVHLLPESDASGRALRTPDGQLTPQGDKLANMLKTRLQHNNSGGHCPIHLNPKTPEQHIELSRIFGRKETNPTLAEARIVRETQEYAEQIATFDTYGNNPVAVLSNLHSKIEATMTRRLVEIALEEAANGSFGITPATRRMREFERDAENLTDAELDEFLKRKNPKGHGIIDKVARELQGVNDMFFNFVTSASHFIYSPTEIARRQRAARQFGHPDSLAELSAATGRTIIDLIPSVGTRWEAQEAARFGIASSRMMRSLDAAATRWDIDGKPQEARFFRQATNGYRALIAKASIEDGLEAGYRNAAMDTILAHANKEWDDVLQAQDPQTIAFRHRFFDARAVDGFSPRQRGGGESYLPFTRDMWNVAQEIRARDGAGGDGMAWAWENHPSEMSDILSAAQAQADNQIGKPSATMRNLIQALPKSDQEVFKMLWRAGLVFLRFRAKMTQLTTSALRNAYALKAEGDRFAVPKAWAEFLGGGMVATAAIFSLITLQDWARGNIDDPVAFMERVFGGSATKAEMNRFYFIATRAFGNSEIPTIFGETIMAAGLAKFDDNPFTSPVEEIFVTPFPGISIAESRFDEVVGIFTADYPAERKEKIYKRVRAFTEIPPQFLIPIKAAGVEAAADEPAAAVLPRETRRR